MAVIPFPARLPLRERALGEAEAQTLLTANRVNTAPAPAPAPHMRVGQLTEVEKEIAHHHAMLGKIHIARDWCIKNLKGYSEYVYRATLEDMYAVTSAADLTTRQMHSLLLHFASIGWKKRPRKSREKHAPAAYITDTSGLNREQLLAKIKAMLEEKASAEGTDVPWAYAVGILKHQSGNVTKALDQATREQLAGVIAALWRDARRKKRRCR